MTQEPVTSPAAVDPATLLADAISALQTEIKSLTEAPKTIEGAEDASKRFSRAVQNLRILIREARDIAKSSAATAAGASDEEIALYLLDSPVGFAIFQRALATRNLAISALDGRKVAQVRRPPKKGRSSERARKMVPKKQAIDKDMALSDSDRLLPLGDLDGW